MVSYSTNRGNTWTRCNLSPTTPGYAYCLAVAPSATNKIYTGGRVGNAGKVFVSTNFGVSWNETSTAPAETVYSLAVHPTDENLVYAATPGGLYRTTDGGNNWTNLGSRGLRAVRLSPGPPEMIAVGGDFGVFISTNGGNNWDTLNTGLENRKVNWLEFAVNNGLNLYAGTNGGATYRYNFPMGIETEPANLVDFKNLWLSPNPSSGKLQFNQSLKEPLQIKLWDVTGRLVWQDQIKTLNKQFNLPEIRTGVYRMELISESDKIYQKVVITR